MATYVEINGNKYEASITGRLHDKDWDDRASKAIKLRMGYAEALALFVDNVKWNILQDIEVSKEIEDEEGNIKVETVIEQEVYDNSDYSVAGAIIDHRDGTITVKMGCLTAEELLVMFEEVL
jgi:hypothetical protein